jgi:hypothetical protein
MLKNRMFKKPILIIFSVLVMIIFIISFSGTLNAMSWPSEDAVLFRNFGSNRNGNPVLGMVFSGGAEILAAEDGEVIFSRKKNDTASRLPSTLGAWTAIDHGDGLISIYSRYADDTRVSLTHVEKSQPIASSGVSGWSTQSGFYFIIFDRRDRHWINPEMLVTPVNPPQPVQIFGVELINAQGNSVSPGNLSQGRYKLNVNASSPASIPGGVALAPQRIVCLINGSEAGSLNFEAFSARDGTLMVYRNGLIPAKQVYAPFPAFEAAEISLTRGQANMEIIVYDITDNSRSTVSRLIVN